MHTRIEVLAVVAVRPSIEGAVFHGRQVVRDQVRAKFVTLVDDGPERAALRLEGQSVWVAEAACKNAPASTRAIDFPDRSPIFLRLDAVLSDVAVGADADIKQRAVSTGRQALRPVVIDRAARQRRQRHAARGDSLVAVMVRVTHDGVSVRKYRSSPTKT